MYFLASHSHRENAGTLGMVPLIINPIYTLYSGFFWGSLPFIWVMVGARAPITLLMCNFRDLVPGGSFRC